MISNFFVLSPRGDTIIFKQYRTNSHNTSSSSTETTSTAHERSNTEAFFRKIKFWDDTSMMTFSSMNALDSYMTQQQNSNLSNQNNALLADPNATDPNASTNNENSTALRTGDAPPVFPMPDGHTYIHIKRNGLIFAASTIRNISPNTVLEVRLFVLLELSWRPGLIEK